MKMDTKHTKKRRVYTPPDSVKEEFHAIFEDLCDYTGDGLVTDHLLDKINSKHRQRHMKTQAA